MLLRSENWDSQSAVVAAHQNGPRELGYSLVSRLFWNSFSWVMLFPCTREG